MKFNLHHLNRNSTLFFPGFLKGKIFFILFTIPAVLHSQNQGIDSSRTETKDTAGLHQKTLFDNASINMVNVFSGYGYRNVRTLTIGTDISGSFYYSNYPMDGIYGVSLAVYPGNSKSFRRSTEGYSEPFHLNQIYFNNSLKYKSSDGYIFITPGVSLFSKNRKYSLDIFQKLSTPIMIDGYQQIMPYKVSLHF